VSEPGAIFEHADFFAGMITMGHLVAAGFFFRFWRRTKDKLFLAFACAFVLIAIQAALTSVLGLPLEERSWLYLLRAGAFSLIIVAIWEKNFSK
jgi:hypothetical protein